MVYYMQEVEQLMERRIKMETLINRGYKFKIVPTKAQKEFFLQSFACASKIYNMYVDELYKQLEQSGYQNGFINR